MHYHVTESDPRYGTISADHKIDTHDDAFTLFAKLADIARQRFGPTYAYVSSIPPGFDGRFDVRTELRLPTSNTPEIRTVHRITIKTSVQGQGCEECNNAYWFS